LYAYGPAERIGIGGSSYLIVDWIAASIDNTRLYACSCNAPEVGENRIGSVVGSNISALELANQVFREIAGLFT